MVEYNQVLINHYRKMYPVIEEFMICMEFLGVDKEDVYFSLLEEDSAEEDPAMEHPLQDD